MWRGGVGRAAGLAAILAVTGCAVGAAPSARAQTAQAATSSAFAAVQPSGSGSGDDAQAAQRERNLAGRAVDKMKDVARQAGDIFSRVPCLPPKGGVRPLGSLPHVASKLIAGDPVVIVAFGSSSTQGHGSSSPAFNYPNRLASQLRRQYPTAEISVINRGKGGEDAPEMLARLKSSVLDLKPDLVIWQVGTNAILRDLDPADTAKMVEEGVSAIQAAGADLVLVDPQYAPRVNERAENAGRMMKLLNRVAEIRHVGLFPRFEVMRDWHERQSVPIDNFITPDGLHMNDWGYACFAQLLGDDIIRSVGQIKLGIHVPSDVHTYRPM
ncbi:MAG: SGNH/GDSL hydrolase family protein [Rhodopseudomonas palustris]|nr:SGNH/GDSL hydrolase family protein [Rhodopseudomonas palustris]